MSSFPNKLVAVLNQSIEGGVLLNALAHMSIALGARLGPEPLQLIDYIDQEKNCYPSISKMPFIILKTSQNKLAELMQKAEQRKCLWSAFIDTMTIGSWQEQLECTSQAKKQDLKLYGITLFGPWEEVSEWTRKFSLWK